MANPANVVATKPDENTGAEETDNDIPGKDENAGEAEILPEDTGSKGKTRRRRGNYDEVYLKKKELKTRQPVYISQEVHQDITRLVHLLALMNKGISVGGYIDNVLSEHLRQHKDEIADLYRQQLDDFVGPKKNRK